MEERTSLYYKIEILKLGSNLSRISCILYEHKLMQCKGRYTEEKNGLEFPIKGYYFTERRCGEIAIQDELCKDCLEKRKKTIVKNGLNYSPKYQQYNFQGKIDEPYYENSWIYGSQRYLKWVALDGNAIGPEKIAKAEKAQRIARGNLEMKAVPEPKAEVKKKGRPKKNGTVVSSAAATPAETPVAPALTSTAPVVNNPSPKPKKVVKKTPLAPVAKVAKAVESPEPTLEAIEVIKIQLIPKIIADKSYWYDSTKDKVYEKPKDGSIGKYLGRYDSRDQKLVSFPDSDVE
jgi:hypothetical protein